MTPAGEGSGPGRRDGEQPRDDRRNGRRGRTPAPRGRIGLLALLTLLCWGGSTAAFAVQRQTTGAVLGVLAGLASAAMVWSWIRSN